MKRRHFLAATAATAGLASTTSAPARQSGRLKVIVPPMNPAELSDLNPTASDVDLVECRSEAEAIWAARREKMARADARRRAKSGEKEFAAPRPAELQ